MLVALQCLVFFSFSSYKRSSFRGVVLSSLNVPFFFKLHSCFQLDCVNALLLNI